MSLFNAKVHLDAFRELLGLLTRHRQLTWEMTRREFSERYAGQVLGLIWTLAHPLILMGVYIFVFAVVFQSKMARHGLSAPDDFTRYLLCGLIPWMATMESLNKSVTAITMDAPLVKQVIFPIEILPVKTAVAAYITQIISTILLTGYILFRSHALPLTYVLLPVLHMVQILGLIGWAYLFSSVGAYFKDLKDIIQVFCIVSMYTMPMFFQPGQAPEGVRFVFYLNPFSYMIWCYQDVCYFGEFKHLYAWPVFIGMNLFMFYFGYRVFARLKVMFGNVV
jgi:lipopolysaccharide transport system permease protein